MIKTNFYPLRTIVGPSIPTASVIILPTPNDSLTVKLRRHPGIEAPVNSGIYDAVDDPFYSRFLPDIIKDGVTYRPMAGMDTMPVPVSNVLPADLLSGNPLLELFANPSDSPFPETDPVISIFGFQERDFAFLQLREPLIPPTRPRIKAFHSGQDETYSFLIALERKVLVGGICFSGYPFISSRIENTPEGMTVGNFGLPREIRLTPLPPIDEGKTKDELIGFHRSQFIDAEYAYTRQEMISHSGLNYLTIDPVRTNLFMLTITDLPFIPRVINLDGAWRGEPGNPLIIEGFKGFAIPYLYFFEYREQTKRPARLHAGLLGVKPEYPKDQRMDGDNLGEQVLRRAFPEFEFCFFDGGDSTTVTGVILDSSGIALPDVTVTLQRTGQTVSTDSSGSFVFNDLRPDDVLIVTAAPFGEAEIPIRGRAQIEIQLPYVETIEGGESVYCVFSAHSALGQRRQFMYRFADFDYPERFEKLWKVYSKETGLRECFVSHLLKPNETVTLYLQQGEELDRCVAGFKAIFLLVPDDDFSERLAERFANVFGVGTPDNRLFQDERTFIEDALALISGLPPEVDFCERIGVKIYELDPLEGVSPAAVEPGSKYSTLLVDTIIDDFADVIFSQAVKGIPFRRSSTSKYFALQLTNKGRANGQIAIHSLQMMRSAHVAVQPRAAKTQQVKAMHYRLIGAELADDFSRLGNEGFNFSIDRLVAGQTKSVLYSAISLLDLLHTGNARIQSNNRRRAIEFEMTENFRSLPGQGDRYVVKRSADENFSGVNFEVREADNTSTSWRSVESGAGVSWPLDKYAPGFDQFESYSGTEIRSRNEQVSSLLDPLFASLNDLRTQLRILIGGLVGGNLIEYSTASNKIFLTHLEGGFGGIWKPFQGFDLNTASLPRVPGYQVLNIPPFFLNHLDAIDSMLRGLRLNVGNLGDVGANLTLRNPELDDLISRLAMINGIGIGLNGGVGAALNPIATAALTVAGVPVIPSFSAGASLSINSNLTTALRSSTNGAVGSIVLSGQELKYSLNRNKQEGYDNNVVHTEFNESEQKRIVTRRELEGRDKERLRGAEVMWQDKIQDIVTGTIPLNFTLPATATKLNYRTADETLRVRFNSGFSSSVEVDFWFELTEETIRDDN